MHLNQGDFKVQRIFHQIEKAGLRYGFPYVRKEHPGGQFGQGTPNKAGPLQLGNALGYVQPSIWRQTLPQCGGEIASYGRRSKAEIIHEIQWAPRPEMAEM